jgi:hypothetical protein
MRYSRRPRYVRGKTRKQRGSGNISVNTSLSEVKQRILKQYSDLIAKKEACSKKCIEFMCSRHNTTVCEQTKEFLTRKTAMDSSGFCNNMMAGFPKSCRLASGNLAAPYGDCVCDRFKHALYEFDMFKGRIERIANDVGGEHLLTISKIVNELFDHINKPGVSLSEESRRFVKLQRKMGSISLNI